MNPILAWRALHPNIPADSAPFTILCIVCGGVVVACFAYMIAKIIVDKL